MSTDAIRIREYPIHPALAPYVKCIWSLESDGSICGEGRERILLDSCVELVFHFHDPYRSHFASGESALQPPSFVVGQMKRFRIFPSQPPDWMATDPFAAFLVVTSLSV